MVSSLPVKSSELIMNAKEASSAVAKFSAKFCNELDKSTNVVSSPLSAENLLALLTLGSTDPAHEELLTSLDIPNDDCIRSLFASITSKLKSIKGITLDIANRVYLNEGPYDVNSKLKEDAINIFDASFERLDFNDGAMSVTAINKWVESKTNERIKDLLSPNSINSETRAILVNALYFKGMWITPFEAMNTMDRPFHIDTQTTVDVPMMYNEDTYKYGDSPELQAQILEMAYEGKQASMVVVLPHEIEGLNGVLKKLADGYDLMSELDKMLSTKVKVTIPKFKIETEIDLMEVLPKLGINAIFDRANSGLTKILDNNEPLYVSKAVQKAFIEVDEKGTEAAAASVMGIARHSLILNAPPVPKFTADKPFLVAILVDGMPYFIATHRGPVGE